MTTLDYERQLNTVPLFQNIPLEKVNCFRKIIKRNRIANEVFSGREYVGIILSGVIDVYTVLADATEIRISQLKQGDIYGICNLFYNYERETILLCKKDCEILFIVKEDFKQLLYENEELSVEREDFYYEKENGGIVMRYGSYDHCGVCWLW